MSILLCSLVHTIFISRLLVLQKSVFPNYIYRILGSLVGFGGSLCSGVTTDFSSTFFVRPYLVSPLIGLIPFSGSLSLFSVNLRFRVISFVFWVTSSGFQVSFSLEFSLAELTLSSGTTAR